METEISVNGKILIPLMETKKLRKTQTKLKRKKQWKKKLKLKNISKLKSLCSDSKEAIPCRRKAQKRAEISPTAENMEHFRMQRAKCRKTAQWCAVFLHLARCILLLKSLGVLHTFLEKCHYFRNDNSYRHKTHHMSCTWSVLSVC